jgi:hypothetical protein
MTDEKKPTKPKFIAFEDEEGRHHVLVMHYISGMMCSMAKDNVHVSAVFIAAGGPNIIVPCGRSVGLANALVEVVRLAIGHEAEYDNRVMSLNMMMKRLREKGADSELVVAETVIEH